MAVKMSMKCLLIDNVFLIKKFNWVIATFVRDIRPDLKQELDTFVRIDKKTWFRITIPPYNLIFFNNQTIDEIINSIIDKYNSIMHFDKRGKYYFKHDENQLEDNIIYNNLESYFKILKILG